MIILFLLALLSAGLAAEKSKPQLFSLLPEVQDWKLTETPQSYHPETIYEYINGAAEIYLAYDFRQLVVAQYGQVEGQAAVSVEIYDLGEDKNSFGIYSAERFPESRFIGRGLQGYLEEGALNFLAGKYYVKLLCYGCGADWEEILRLFSKKIEKRIKEKGQFPRPLSAFPRKGLVANSEKLFLRNFMGYSFLRDGFLASYRLQGLEFECFIIEGDDEQDAQSMLEQYLNIKSGHNIQKILGGYRLQNRYYRNIFLGREKNFICGVLGIKDGFEETGKEYLQALLKAVLK